MSIRKVCDHCQQIIDRNQEYVHIELNGTKGSLAKYRDYHVDCFNYKFSTDIRVLNQE